jgi:hypothetical protein
MEQIVEKNGFFHMNHWKTSANAAENIKSQTKGFH